MARRGAVDDRIDQIMSEANLHSLERLELMSLVCRRLCQGFSADQIEKEVLQLPRYAPIYRREYAWRLAREAGRQGLLRFVAPAEQQLGEAVADKFDWRRDRLTVVRTAMLEDVAHHAAERLWDLVRDYCSSSQQDEVHVGFAGGRTLREVARHFAQLLREPADGGPRKIVFHAMVAAFNDTDFDADPNNFIAYFEREQVSVEIAFLRMPAPGIVETAFRGELLRFRAIREVYEEARKINIIVSSGGRWGDEHSTLATYLRQVGDHDDAVFERLGAVGDLLWQPVSKEGPLEIDPGTFEYRANTLVELQQLPGFIQNGGRVLLVLGSCSKCHMPKGVLLHAILQGHPRLVTDIVVDSPTVQDVFKNLPEREGVPQKR